MILNDSNEVITSMDEGEFETALKDHVPWVKWDRIFGCRSCDLCFEHVPEPQTIHDQWDVYLKHVLAETRRRDVRDNMKFDHMLQEQKKEEQQ